MLVRVGLSMKNVVNTGFEVIDGKGMPVRIVDSASGEEALEVMPLGCSLNLVRRSARSSFGYTRQVLVAAVPQRAPGQESGNHLGNAAERTAVRRLTEWEDLWTEWSEKCGERRVAEVEWRVLKASGVAMNAELSGAPRRAALVDLEALVSLRANLHGVDAHMMRAIGSVLGGAERASPTVLADAAARVVWRLAGHPDARVTTLIWEQNIVRSLALAANAAEVRAGPPPALAPETDWYAHAAALAVLLESATARRAYETLRFDPIPALLRLVDAAQVEAGDAPESAPTTDTAKADRKSVV